MSAAESPSYVEEEALLAAKLEAIFFSESSGDSMATAWMAAAGLVAILGGRVQGDGNHVYGVNIMHMARETAGDKKSAAPVFGYAITTYRKFVGGQLKPVGNIIGAVANGAHLSGRGLNDEARVAHAREVYDMLSAARFSTRDTLNFLNSETNWVSFGDVDPSQDLQRAELSTAISVAQLLRECPGVLPASGSDKPEP